MPLHLLGKKSWNVYNSANIERVRRDEALAEAREAAEEQRLQLEDAQERTRILRGDTTVQDNGLVVEQDGQHDSGAANSQRQHKRRRLHGEDDTDRDIRWAREDAELGKKATSVLARRTDDISITDRDGHIQLVPVEQSKSIAAEKNAEAEADKARSKRQEEDQYTMRFSNAAGFKNNMQAPWYADAKTRRPGPKDKLISMPEKDVWGNEDPRRSEREQKRVTSNDPLAFMQEAQRQLKQSTRDREEWQAERKTELRQLEREQRKRHRRRHDHDDLDDFRLDASEHTSAKVDHETRHHHRRSHRRGSRSRHRE